MNPIEEALANGYDEDQILNFVSQKYPEITKKISKAVKSGYTPRNILNFLAPFFSRSEPTSPSKTQQEAHYKKRQQDIEANKKLVKDVATTGATLGTGYLAGRALQNVAPKIGSMLGKVGVGTSPKQVAQAPVEAAMGSLQGEQQVPIAPPIPVPERPKASSIIKEMGLDKRIESLKGNNPPEVIGPAIRSMLTPGQSKWLKEKTDQPIEEIVSEYLTEQPEPAVQEVKNEEPKQASKLVELPDGRIGNLLEEKQGIASIEMPDGKVRRKKSDDLVEEPPELEKQITELLESLPEDEKSAVLAFASYNPGNEFTHEGKTHNIPFMGVQFHNGDFYLYPGVSKEQYDKVVSKAVKAKTTGNNPWHAWTQGKDSRGAGMHELIRELEKEFGKNFVKFKASEGYDYFKRVREIVKKLEREKRKRPT